MPRGSSWHALAVHTRRRDGDDATTGGARLCVRHRAELGGLDSTLEDAHLWRGEWCKSVPRLVQHKLQRDAGTSISERAPCVWSAGALN